MNIDWSKAPCWADSVGERTYRHTTHKDYAWIGVHGYIYGLDRGTDAKCHEFNSGNELKDFKIVARKECSHAKWDSSGCMNCGAQAEEVERQALAEPVYKSDLNAEVPPPAWTGEGLPPVGLDVYVDHTHAGGGLTVVKILAHTQARKLQCAVYQAGDEVSYASSGCFKPIPTAEQIAAEEREAKIQELSDAAGLTVDGYRSVFEKIIDAGYRKQVQP